MPPNGSFDFSAGLGQEPRLCPIQWSCSICVEHTVLFEPRVLSVWSSYPSSPNRYHLKCHHHVLRKDAHPHLVGLGQILKAIRRNAVVSPIETSQRVSSHRSRLHLPINMRIPPPSVCHHLLVCAAADDVLLSVLIGAALGTTCVHIRQVEMCQITAMPVLIVCSVSDGLVALDRHPFLSLPDASCPARVYCHSLGRARRECRCTVAIPPLPICSTPFPTTSLTSCSRGAP